MINVRGILLLAALTSCIDTAPLRTLPASCFDILSSDPETADGVYAISRYTDDGTSSRQVYCDMTTDGGGWTLVGRSIDWASPFGWTSTTGFVHDDSGAYSLDASDVPFTEVLVGARDAGKSWSNNVYKLAVEKGIGTKLKLWGNE